MSPSKKHLGRLRDRFTRRQLELRQLRIEHRAALRRTTPREGAKFRGFMDVLRVVMGGTTGPAPAAVKSPLQPFRPILPAGRAPRLAGTGPID